MLLQYNFFWPPALQMCSSILMAATEVLGHGGMCAPGVGEGRNGPYTEREERGKGWNGLSV